MSGMGISDKQLKKLLGELWWKAIWTPGKTFTYHVGKKCYIGIKFQGNPAFFVASVFYRYGKKRIPTPRRVAYPPRAYLTRLLSLLPIKIKDVRDIQYFQTDEPNNDRGKSVVFSEA